MPVIEHQTDANMNEKVLLVVLSNISETIMSLLDKIHKIEKLIQQQEQQELLRTQNINK